MSTDSIQTSTGSFPKKRRVILGRFGLILLPFVVLGLAEGACRLAGLGGFSPMVREVADIDGQRLCEVDWQGAESFFMNNRPGRGSNHQQSFFSPKSDDTVRIFLVGGSAIKGFPQPLPLTAGAFLEQMLESAWPAKKVEVINMGITGVASFPAEQCARVALLYDPDLIVVFSGHNEFYGAYGVASQHWGGTHPALTRLTRTLHASALVQGMARLRPAKAPQHAQTMMEAMMGSADLAPDSALRKRAVESLGHHVRRLARSAQQAGVPLMVCTLPVNECDFEPIGTTDPSHPSRIAYRRGVEALGDGQGASARALFQRSIDLDPQPWRATESLQEVITSVAKESDAWLCDARAAFRAVSPNGCVGVDLMDDHVHPSLRGQFELARAIVQRLARTDGPLAVAEQDVPATDEWEVYATRQGANVFDAMGTTLTLVSLLEGPVFKDSNQAALSEMITRAERMTASLPFALRTDLESRMRTDAEQQMRTPVSGLAGAALAQQGALADAERLYEFACRSLPPYSSARREYAFRRFEARLARLGRLSNEDHPVIELEISRGLTLLRYGENPSGRSAYFVGKLYGLLGDTNKETEYTGLARKIRASGKQ